MMWIFKLYMSAFSFKLLQDALSQMKYVQNHYNPFLASTGTVVAICCRQEV